MLLPIALMISLPPVATAPIPATMALMMVVPKSDKKSTAFAMFSSLRAEDNRPPIASMSLVAPVVAAPTPVTMASMRKLPKLSRTMPASLHSILLNSPPTAEIIPAAAPPVLLSTPRRIPSISALPILANVPSSMKFLASVSKPLMMFGIFPIISSTLPLRLS